MRALSCMSEGGEVAPADLELIRIHALPHELNLPVDSMARLVALRILVED